MKQSQNPWKKTGLCYVCGKPTQLLIHQECVKKMDAQKSDKGAMYKDRKRRYSAGHVPKFCHD